MANERLEAFHILILIQGCVLSPILCYLFTSGCVTPFLDSLIVKFADDSTVAGLIHNDDMMKGTISPKFKIWLSGVILITFECY